MRLKKIPFTITLSVTIILIMGCFQYAEAQMVIKSDTSDYDILFRDNTGELSSFHNNSESINVSITDFSGGFIVEYYRAILQFDISELTSSVDKAVFHVYSEASGGNDFDIDLYGSSSNRNDFIHASESSSTDEFSNSSGFGYSKIGGVENLIEHSDPDFEWYTVDITSFINNRISDYQLNSADSVVVLKIRPDESYNSASTNFNLSSGNDTDGKEPFLTIYDGSTDQKITGTEGWRMLSTPTSDNTYDDLLGNLWTQGISTGADATNGEASVKKYGGSSFNPVNDLTTTMTPGEGFITYVFSDDDFDGTSDGFPKTISVTGSENTGTVNPTLNSGGNAWSLVGNPYAFPIAWGELDKTDLTGTVYVYDNTITDYISWNGTSGSLTDGRIATMQGFWVQNSASATSESLTIEETDKANDADFYKEAIVEPEIKLVASSGKMKNNTFLSFTKNAETEKDNFDGLQLSPLDFENYLSIATLTGDTKLDINNLPLDFENELEVPVVVDAFYADPDKGSWVKQGGKVTLNWNKAHQIPKDWKLTLTDFETGKSINMKTFEEYTFTLNGEVGQAKVAPSTTILNPEPPQVERLAKGVGEPRFTITISKGKATSNSPTETPEAFALQQNYPNPFNPTTSIQYSVGQAGPVTLSVYNVMGQKVATLVSETKATGTYRANWDAANMASGIYHYRLQSAGQVITKQMTLIK